MCTTARHAQTSPRAVLAAPANDGGSDVTATTPDVITITTYEEAKDAYRKAISLGRNYFYLKMKLDDLDASSS